jgi:hypothetical protein
MSTNASVQVTKETFPNQLTSMSGGGDRKTTDRGPVVPSDIERTGP